MVEYVPNLTQGGWEHIPAHVIGFGGLSDYHIFLDTRLGVIYFPGGQGNRNCCSPGPTRVAGRAGEPFKPIRDYPDSYAPEEESEWRADGWAITEFFEVLKYHFRVLNYVPMNRQNIEEHFEDPPGSGNWQHNMPELAEAMLRVREIYTEHGWPDLTQYRKNECIMAVEKLMKEHYPDIVL
jgi:hypothetical protein